MLTTNMAANASSVSARALERTMTCPSPPFPRNSPITAPTTASGIATFSPTKICGSAFGKRTLRNVRHFGASSDFVSSMSSAGVDFRPVAEARTIGKKHMRTTIPTLELMPNPSHTTRSGASATLGIAFRATSHGDTVRSTRLEAAISAPAAIPTTTLIRKPVKLSARVIIALSLRRDACSTSFAATFCGAGRMIGRTPR